MEKIGGKEPSNGLGTRRRKTTENDGKRLKLRGNEEKRRKTNFFVQERENMQKMLKHRMEIATQKHIHL